MSTTSLSDLLGKKDTQIPEEKIYLDPENITKTIVDFSISEETRLEALNIYYKNFGRNDSIEIINRLSTMYQMSGTTILKKYLFSICTKSNIDPFLKSISAKGLYMFDEKDDTGYQAVDKVIPMMNNDSTIGTPYKIEFVKILMNSKNYRQNARDYFCQIISDQNIECDYRYKAILSLDKNHAYFSKEACVEFVQDKKNETLYRILAGQNILQNYDDGKVVRNMVEKIMFFFAKDTSMPYNLRADATDVLLQLGSDDAKKEAEKIIMKLGQDNGSVITLYDNAQNVHTQEISESVNRALEFLHTFKILEVNGIPISVSYVEKQLKKLLKKKKAEMKVKKGENFPLEEKVKVTMNRILIDRALYSNYNCNLSHVLLRIWTYIVGNDHEQEMKERLLQEMEDMAGTCSSGYITRLVNTISGFGDFSMTISWRDQLISNLSGRLNARARKIEDPEEQGNVMSEMTVDTDDYENRKHFLKFLRKNLLSIREELWEEFKDHIDDTDFDLYFRFAVSQYETGKFM